MNARAAAMKVMRAVRRGDLADRALVHAAEALEPRERRFLQELVYGALRLQGRLDYIIAQHASRPLARIHADVLDALRLGVYQLLEMDGVPQYAAVSETVELVKQAQPKAAGFTNAVLQSVLRQQTSPAFPTLEADPLAHLVSALSHPQWLAARWLTRFGAADAAALANSNNQRPELYLRLLSSAARAQLDAAGVTTEPHPLVQDVVALPDAQQLATALASAPCVVQDPAAALVVQYAAIPEGALVADLCAAPGGKALGLAASGARYTVASDLSLGRMRRVRENRERVGRGAELGLLVADGRVPAVRGADVVLLDAPCTGTGTFRRHPDARWRIKPKDLSALVHLQRELLTAAGALLGAGGLLVYSTCSLEPEENEAQVEWFLREHRDYRLEPADAVPAAVLDDGMLRVLPHVHDMDGAFAARLRRIDAG